MKYIILILSMVIYHQTLTAQEKKIQQFEAFKNQVVQEKVYVHTDRSLYEPGESIWFKAYVLNAQLLATVPSSILRAELIAPDGQIFKKHQLTIWEGSAQGDFILPPNAVGGLYKLKVYTLWQKNFPEMLCFEKELTVQKQRLPKILMTLDFQRESYGSGSEVVADLELRSKDNEVLSLHNFEYQIRLAGKLLKQKKMDTELDGRAKIEFTLPKHLNTADVLLTILTEYQGDRASISRAVPIPSHKIDLQLLAEGGHTLIGVPSKIAFKAVDEFGKNVDVAGGIYNSKNKLVTSFKSYHQGMGSFDLIPKQGEQYYAKIESPIYLDKKYFLPLSSTEGIAIRINQKLDSLYIKTTVLQQQYCTVVIQMQDSIYYHKTLKATVGENNLNLSTRNWPIGVAQITIFDEKERPQVERLCFVNKDRPVALKIKTNQEKYLIRDSILVDIWAKDAAGFPIEADLSMAVVNDQNWTLANDKQDNILSNLLLSSDLKGEIFEPNFYFDPKELKADTALDYVMLTHGYRRFQWRDLADKVDFSILYPAEPAQQVLGKLKYGDQPLANHTIKVTTRRKQQKGFPFFVRSDKWGNFIISKLPTEGTIKLHTQVGGRWYHSKTISFDASSITGIDDPRRGTGVYSVNKVSAENTLNFQDIYRFSSTHSVDISEDQINSESSSSIIKGYVYNEQGEPMPFASVRLYNNAFTVATTSDFEGIFNLSSIPPGTYDLVVRYVGYSTIRIKDLYLKPNRATNVEVKFSEEIMVTDQNLLEEVIIIGARRLIPIENSMSTGSQVLNSTGLNLLSTPSTTSIRTTVSDASQLTTISTRKVIRRSSKKKKVIDKNRLKRQRRMNKRLIRPLRKANKPTKNTSTTNNSILYTMQQMKGETPYNKKGNGRNGNITTPTIAAPNIKATFNTHKSLYYNRLYNARVFYAPDYSYYHTLRKKVRHVQPIRKDFPSTLYWQPYVQTDSTGHAQITFFNADDVTTYRIIIEGIGANGAVLRGEQTYAVQTPFELDAQVPKTLSKQDSLYLPLTLRNNTSDTIVGTLQIITSLTTKTVKLDSLLILPHQFLQKQFPFYVSNNQNKTGQIKAIFKADGFNESIVQTYELEEKLFPMEASFSSNAAIFEKEIYLDSVYPGTLNGNFRIYTDPLNNMAHALESMIRQPAGCFEQVSSNNYPNILALQLMQQLEILHPTISDKALNYLDYGYKKLESYQCSTGGWEWFGRDPAHEVLTAYGLMQFKDMAAVYHKIDPEMIERAKNWLISRKNNDGGWLIEGAHYGWGKAEAVSDAYILYALAYIGVKNLEKERKKVTTEALKSKDLYRLGLATLANFQLYKRTEAEKLLTQMQNILATQNLAHQLPANHTVNYSRGKALSVQILSFAILASLESSKTNKTIVKKYYEALIKHRNRSYFGGTQATVWALKAILAYNKKYPQQKIKESYLTLWVNDQKVHKFMLNAELASNNEFNHLEKWLRSGKNTIRIEVENSKTVPTYEFSSNWFVHTPPTSENSTLSLTTNLMASAVKQAEPVRLEVNLKNQAKIGAPSPMAVIGIPAGLNLQSWQLKAMQKREEFDYYELKDNYLILYFRGLQPLEERSLAFDLKADIPGIYQAPASSCYLYYEPENKFWVAGEQVSIQ